MGGGSSSSSWSHTTVTNNKLLKAAATTLSTLPNTRWMDSSQCIPCEGGRHAFLHNNCSITTRGVDGNAIKVEMLAYCKSCQIIVKLADICNGHCPNYGCKSMFYCFRNKNHEGNHVCCRCSSAPLNSGGIRVPEAERVKALSDTHGFQQVRIAEESKRNLDRLARRRPASRNPSNLQPTRVPQNTTNHVITFFHPYTPFQVTTAAAMVGHDETITVTESGGHHSSSGWFSSSSSSWYNRSDHRSLATTSKFVYRSYTAILDSTGDRLRVMNHQDGSRSSTDSNHLLTGTSNTNNQIVHRVDNEGALVPIDDNVLSLSPQAAVPLPQDESTLFLFGQQRPLCSRGEHEGCVSGCNVFRKEAMQRNRTSVNHHLQCDTLQRVDIEISIVTCRKCNVSVSLAYDEEQDVVNSALQPYINNSDLTSFNAQLRIVDTSRNDSAHVSERDIHNPLRFVQSLSVPSTYSLLFSDAIIARMFPGYSYATTCTHPTQPKHVFAIYIPTSVDVTEYDQWLTELQTSSTMSHSSSTSFACFTIQSSRQERSTQTHSKHLSGLLVHGALRCGFFKCRFCSTCTADPARELPNILSSVSVEGFVAQSESREMLTLAVGNIAREEAYRASFAEYYASASAHSSTSSNSNSSNCSNSSSNSLPLSLYSWITLLAAQHCAEEHWWRNTIFLALQQEEVSLAWLLSAGVMDSIVELRRILLHVHNITAEQWRRFISELNLLRETAGVNILPLQE